MGQGLGQVADGFGAMFGLSQAVRSVGVMLNVLQRSDVPEFWAHADSPSGDGSKCIVSSPITDMTPVEFWSLFSKALKRDDVLARPPCVSYKWSEQPDGGILVIPTLPASDGGKISMHIVWYVNSDNDEATGINYHTDSTLSEVFSRITLRAFHHPFVLECKTEVAERREAGEGLKTIMEGVLKSLNSEVTCRADAPSPDGSGGKSVVSDHIHDTITSPDMFWRQTKEYIKSQAYEICPDGSVVQRIQVGWWLWGAAYYTKHAFNEKTNEICSYSYGDDALLSEDSLDRVSHLRVHRKPYRLEMFTVIPKHSADGEIEKLFLMDFLNPVFKHHKDLKEVERSNHINEELAMMRKEMKAYQQEMTSAIQALRKDVVALRGKEDGKN
uniref:Uncharacterized protein n=1 Tax=Alexandrium catenella TaxID=2925 RepID=A0A7S1L6N9_ALECA|mmetsp:Transcript_107496/g.286009  ORF Transcript_107496/g.286009 Transcript_107496/m.286009 type:complete len:385 (+) Transcript_107496:1-1155(+)